MMQFLYSCRDKKIHHLEDIILSGKTDSILDVEKQWWENFTAGFEKQKIRPQQIIERTIDLQEKVNSALTYIKDELTIDQELYEMCNSNNSSFSQDEQIDRKYKMEQSLTEQNQSIHYMTIELSKLRDSLQICEKQNSQLMKRLVKSLERCSLLIDKVDKLKQQNNYLQSQDNNSMKYYQRLLAQNKREIKQKDQMIKLYQFKLEAYRGDGFKSKLTDRVMTTGKGYPYTSQGILDRIQSLRVLAKGKVKPKPNATQIVGIF